MPALTTETDLERRHYTQGTLDRLAREILGQAALDVMINARGQATYDGYRLDNPYAREKVILRHAIRRLEKLELRQWLSHPPYDATGNVLLVAAEYIRSDIERAFVQSIHCVGMRDADTAAGQLHYQGLGLEEAFYHVIPSLQMSGTPGERAIAGWFWDRYVERLRRPSPSGSPI